MAERDIYFGPSLHKKPKEVKVSSTGYTAADQAQGFGIPKSEVEEETPPSGLSREEWDRIRKQSVPPEV